MGSNLILQRLQKYVIAKQARLVVGEPPCCENRLTFGSTTCFDGFQPKLGHRCNMGTLICWSCQRSYIKVKGHLRSSCKIGWKCKSGLIWKVEVRLEPNLVYWYNMGTFICSCSQRSYTKVSGHLRSSFKMGWKCENGLIWKVGGPIWTKLGLLTKYGNLHMFMRSKGHKSRSKFIWGQLVR